MPVFVYPLMLLGLAAVVVPVLIHYLTRPRPVALRFPAFRLLLDAGGGRQALDRLRTIILLSLRCLALIALVLAFAWPLWQRGGDVDPDRAQRVVIIIDASASMGATQGGVPLFTHARSQAADYLTRLQRGSSAGVILAAAQPRPILPALSANLASLHDGLRQASSSYESVDARAALASALAMLEGRGHIVVFSDLQRSNWGAVDFSEFDDVQIHLRPVTREPIENVGITAVEVRPGQPVAGETADLLVRVFNAAARGREVAVMVESSGTSIRRQVTVSPYASAQISFPIGQPAVGIHPGTVRIEGGDAMPSDDVRHFVLSVAPRLEALVISDSPLHDAASGAAFVQRALDPLGDGSSGIHGQRAQSQAIDRQRLEQAALVALVPPLSLSGEVAEILARRLADGLYCLVISDGRERGDGHSALSQIVGASDGLLELPWHAGEPGRDPEQRAPRMSGLARGPMEAFASLDDDPFTAITVSRFRSAQVSASKAEQVFLRHRDGSPALLLQPLGRGGLIVLNIPVEPSLSTLVATPLFPSLLHESLRHLRSQGSEPGAYPGRAWSLVVEDGGSGTLSVTDPEGSEVATQVVSRGRSSRLALPPVALPGLYPVHSDGTVVGYGVVTIDPRESDTRMVAAEDLIDPDGRRPVLIHDDDRRLARAGQAALLWPWLLAFASLGLALEMLLTLLWRRRATPRPGGPR